MLFFPPQTYCILFDLNICVLHYWRPISDNWRLKNTWNSSIFRTFSPPKAEISCCSDSSFLSSFLLFAEKGRRKEERRNLSSSRFFGRKTFAVKKEKEEEEREGGSFSFCLSFKEPQRETITEKKKRKERSNWFFCFFVPLKISGKFEFSHEEIYVTQLQFWKCSKCHLIFVLKCWTDIWGETKEFFANSRARFIQDSVEIWAPRAAAWVKKEIQKSASKNRDKRLFFQVWEKTEPLIRPGAKKRMFFAAPKNVVSGCSCFCGWQAKKTLCN